MSLSNEYITAVDIGTTKIVALVGKKDLNGKIKILGKGEAESKGVRRGVVQNIEECASSIQLAVAEAQNSSGIKFTHVFVGIAGQHIKSIQNRHSKYIESPDNEITQSDVDQLTSDMYKISLDAGEEIIHVLPQSYIVDNESGIKNPVGICGKKLEANFHIVVGQVASAMNIRKCIKRAGLEPIALVLEPLASSDAVLSEDEKEVGVVMVDIGGGTTDIAVYYDNIIRHTAVIPFGGNVITNDIREGCKILHRHAEGLKIQYGSALADTVATNKVVSIPSVNGGEPKEISFKFLSGIIQARVSEILDMVDFEIGNSGIRNKLGAGIVLTGGGALLKDLVSLSKFKFGLDTRVGFPKQILTADTPTDLNHAKYATAIGLLVQGEIILRGLKINELNPVEPDLMETEEMTPEEEDTPVEKSSWSFKKILGLDGIFGTLFIDGEKNDTSSKM